MTRLRKETELEHAERLLDALDPEITPAVDTTALARVASCADARDHAVAALNKAVLNARAEGFSWTDVGIRVGVSRQAARQKYGPLEKQG